MWGSGSGDACPSPPIPIKGTPLCWFSIKPQAQTVPWSQVMVGLIRQKAKMFAKQPLSLSGFDLASGRQI